MRILISFVSALLVFASLSAQAGHEVNDGGLATWYCKGAGYLQGTAGTVNLPFELRISPNEMELTILSTTNSVIRTEKLSLSSRAVNYGNGYAELRSFKPSNALMKDLAAYVTIADIGKVLDHPHNGTVDFSLDNGVRFFTNSMQCNNYF
ncbi:MAG: hypothetical protein JSU04_03315 [Bdellovibrionales bacterium]|nr:hypothetical protein [Bdellovibrionales bacterium]